MITIIDYGLGNLISVQNMLKKIGVTSIITDDKKKIADAVKIILPGVGAFDNGMKQLKQKGLVEILNQKALSEKIPVLGICLGMQLLTKNSEEGTEEGLGWIDAQTVKFRFGDKALKIPHMGWNYISAKKNTRLTNVSDKNRFYFVHSYYVKCNNPEDIMATCNYGSDFTCVINHDNIYGAQFHPEKSLKFGMEFLKRYSEI